MIALKINGSTKQVEVDGDTPLLWVLRDEIGLTGTKFGCGVAACGSCTVHVDGEPQRSCVLPVESAASTEIVTIEGISGPVAEAVQSAWREEDVVQCGYCQSGQIMQAIALLAGNKKPTDSEIDEFMNGNACRCVTYVRIRSAIHLAARKLEA